jgi:dipeptidyl aminopeptidase/acylaminoacyl peptidase
MRARALLPLLPLLPFALPAASYATPALPPCVRPVTERADAAHLSGDGFLRVRPDGSAAWLLRGTRYAAFAPLHVAWWVEPAHDGEASPLCVDGIAVHTGVFAGSLAWSPDGTRLAYTENHTDGTTRVHVLHGGSMPGFGFGWSPDGHRLAVAGAGVVEVRRLDGSLVTTLDTDRWTYAPEWAGDRIAYAASSGDGETYEVVTVHPDGTGRTVLGTDAYARYALAPDGSRAAYAGPAGLVTSAPDGSAAMSLGQAAYQLAFSPDSAALAFTDFAHGATVGATGSAATTVVTGDVTALGWAAPGTPWFTVRAADETRAAMVGGATVAQAEVGHALRIVRRDADGSYVVAVERLRSGGLPTTG